MWSAWSLEVMPRVSSYASCSGSGSMVHSSVGCAYDSSCVRAPTTSSRPRACAWCRADSAARRVGCRAARPSQRPVSRTMRLVRREAVRGVRHPQAQEEELHVRRVRQEEALGGDARQEFDRLPDPGGFPVAQDHRGVGGTQSVLARLHVPGVVGRGLLPQRVACVHVASVGLAGREVDAGDTVTGGQQPVQVGVGEVEIVVGVREHLEERGGVRLCWLGHGRWTLRSGAAEERGPGRDVLTAATPAGSRRGSAGCAGNPPRTDWPPGSTRAGRPRARRPARPR